MDDNQCSKTALMLGTFGLRPKGTLRARALGMAQALQLRGWSFELVTTPWDNPADAGRRWVENNVGIRNTRSVRPVAWPLAVVEMAWRARQIDPTLVHLIKPKGFGDLASRWLRRSIPVVVDMDDWEGNGGWNEIGGYGIAQRRLFDWQERTWPSQADAVTVASRELERHALDLGAHRERVFYVPNGITQQRFDGLQSVDAAAVADFRREHSLSGIASVLLYTRFVEFDPSSVAHVLALVRRDHPGARLVVAGGSHDGSAEARLQFAARQLGVADGIVRLGWISSQQLPIYAAACDVAIHPFDDTLVNRSKSSVKLLELMACGIPIVTASVGENVTFIEDGRSGELCEAKDVASLAAVVTRLLGDPDERHKLGSAARQRVRDCFLWEHLAVRVEQAYQIARGSRIS